MIYETLEWEGANPQRAYLGNGLSVEVWEIPFPNGKILYQWIINVPMPRIMIHDDFQANDRPGSVEEAKQHAIDWINRNQPKLMKMMKK